jgi:hypothetical protein
MLFMRLGYLPLMPCSDISTVSSAPLPSSAFLTVSFKWLMPFHGIDLPPKHVPHFKLELCHFLFLNANMPLALEDGNSMNYVV